MEKWKEGFQRGGLERGVVFHQDGLSTWCFFSSGWPFIRVVSQSGLSSQWSFICKSGLLSGWSLMRVVFPQFLYIYIFYFIFIKVVSWQGVFSSGKSSIRVVSHQSGLLSEWSSIRVVFHQGGLPLGMPPIKVRVVFHQSSNSEPVWPSGKALGW